MRADGRRRRSGRPGARARLAGTGARPCAAPRPAAFLRTLRDADALRAVLPEVDALYGVPQRAEYHPEVDTGVHIEMVCDMAARLAPGDDLIGFAALCHDLGKALTPADELPRPRDARATRHRPGDRGLRDA